MNIKKDLTYHFQTKHGMAMYYIGGFLNASIANVLSSVLQWTFPLLDKILKKIEIGKNITIS